LTIYPDTVIVLNSESDTDDSFSTCVLYFAIALCTICLVYRHTRFKAYTSVIFPALSCTLLITLYFFEGLVLLGNY